MGNDNSIDNKLIDCPYKDNHYCYLKTHHIAYNDMKRSLTEKKQFVAICKCLTQEALELGYELQSDDNYCYATLPSETTKHINKMEKDIKDLNNKLDGVIKLIKDEQLRRVVFNEMVEDEKDINS